MIKALLLVFIFNSVNASDLIQIRRFYYAAYENRESADRFLVVMEKLKTASDPVYIAYTGMAHLMQAKFSKNPYIKLEGFNKGKKLLNAAVSSDPRHIEIRFLRFCVQTDTPAFLGYNGDVESDKGIVLKGWKNCTDTDLKQRIKDFMLKSNYCNSDERRIFK